MMDHRPIVQQDWLDLAVLNKRLTLLMQHMHGSLPVFMKQPDIYN